MKIVFRKLRTMKVNAGFLLQILIAITVIKGDGDLETQVEQIPDATFIGLKNILPGGGKGGGKGGGTGGKGFLPSLPGIGGLGFLGGKNAGGGGGGKGLFGGGGKGLFGGGGKGIPGLSPPQSGDSGKDVSNPVYGQELGINGGEGGACNPCKKQKGRGGGKLNLFSRFSQDLPCAGGFSMLPFLDKIPGLPKFRFPSIVPSGTNICDATCGGKDTNTCTYNWRDSIMGFPPLLFHCFCKDKCPPQDMRFGGYLNIGCENMSNTKSRCKCPYGEMSFKCTIKILPLFQRKNAYYCACWKDKSATTAMPMLANGGEAMSQLVSQVGGYDFGHNGPSTEREMPHGSPLGSEQYAYAHL